MTGMKVSPLGFVVLLLLSACSEPPDAPDVFWPEVKLTAETSEKWARSCALCHVAGEGGAPRMGDSEAWGQRVAKGPEALMRHTREGLNRMPPLGYCMDCSEEDFAAMIKLMAGIKE